MDYFVKTPTKKEYLNVLNFLNKNYMGSDDLIKYATFWEEYGGKTCISFEIKNRKYFDFGYSRLGWYEQSGRYKEMKINDLLVEMKEYSLDNLKIYLVDNEVTITDIDGDMIRLSKDELKGVYEKIWKNSK